MPHPLRSAFVVVVALASLATLRGQEVKAPNPSEEDNRLDHVIEHWLRDFESERDHVAREVERAGGDSKTEEDFGQWYAKLGGDDEGWDRTRIQRNNIREIFDRVATNINLQSPVLSRKQFVSYAKSWWRKDRSPYWREPSPLDTTSEAERVFKHLDRDKNGVLTEMEMPPTLRADLKRWDRNQDGWINLEEYRPYFAQRLDRVYRRWQQRSEKPLPPLDIPQPAEERPSVARAGKLPLGLPAWFDQLDEDRDGQIALHEWRKAGWPLDEFQQLDINDDGFLEPREVLNRVNFTKPDGTRPFAYLFQKKLAGASVGKR
jgi:hypothetical protein